MVRQLMRKILAEFSDLGFLFGPKIVGKDKLSDVIIII
jgi:hypothetical protein